MSAADLLMTDLALLGIRLEAHDDRLRYSPRSAVTPDLARRMKAHRPELLAILRPDANPTAIVLTDIPDVSDNVPPTDLAAQPAASWSKSLDPAEPRLR